MAKKCNSCTVAYNTIWFASSPKAKRRAALQMFQPASVAPQPALQRKEHTKELHATKVCRRRGWAAVKIRHDVSEWVPITAILYVGSLSGQGTQH
jgi:hypothetical protein